MTTYRDGRTGAVVAGALCWRHGCRQPYILIEACRLMAQGGAYNDHDCQRPSSLLAGCLWRARGPASVGPFLIMLKGIDKSGLYSPATPVLVHNCSPSAELLGEADNAEIAGGGFAAEYTSPSGATYRVYNKVRNPDSRWYGRRTFGIHPPLHLGCAEMQCLALAYKGEGPSAIGGGSMTVVHVSDTP